MKSKVFLALGLVIVASLAGTVYFGTDFLRHVQTTSATGCPIQLVQTIPLGGIGGRLDHMTVNPATHTLFLAAFGNDSVQVVDLNAGTVVRSISGFDQPQGVTLIPGSNLLLVTNGGNGTLLGFDLGTFKRTNAVPFVSDADNLRYDNGSRLLYVGYGGGAIGVVDTSSWKITGKIALIGHPESFQIEQGTRMFVNVPAGPYIAVVDLGSLTISSRWPIPNATGNYAMALDSANHRLFVGTRDPPQLVVVDTGSGKIIARQGVPQDPDDIYYDSANDCIYVSTGQGYISVVKQVDSTHYLSVQNLSSSSGARTGLLDAADGRFYLAAPSTSDNQARILVYDLSQK